jgi:beta-glucanase (GH16 family)
MPMVSCSLRLGRRTAALPAAILACALGAPAAAQSASLHADAWDLAWHDEFDGAALDLEKWTPESTNRPANNERQAYLPAQVGVSDGRLVITADNAPSGGQPYRSGRLHSNYGQQFGRWEVRAKLPTSQGMWPAIWLLPNVERYRWPSQGEIDIMENRGTQPTLTSSAFHFGTSRPYFHDYRVGEQTAARFAQPVDFHADFHAYAVEWDAAKLRFFVDDVHHLTVANGDVDGFLAKQTAPMQVVLNVAVGGDFLRDQQPGASTVWPQRMLVDYVRVYRRNRKPIALVNGDFEAGDGSLAGWSTFGARPHTNNVSVHNEAARGRASLKLFGQFTGGASECGASQGITVKAGDEVRATAESFVRSQDALAGTRNAVQMKIEFYDDFGAKRGSSQLAGEAADTIAGANSPADEWVAHEIAAVAPPGAVEARLAFVFQQTGNEPGAVHIDNATLSVAPRESGP